MQKLRKQSRIILASSLGSAMDCERLLLAMKKWGYRGVSYSYLTKLLGLTPEEAEKCGKKGRN